METNSKEEHNVCSGLFDGNKVTFGALSGPTAVICPTTGLTRVFNGKRN